MSYNISDLNTWTGYTEDLGRLFASKLSIPYDSMVDDFENFIIKVMKFSGAHTTSVLGSPELEITLNGNGKYYKSTEPISSPSNSIKDLVNSFLGAQGNMFCTPMIDRDPNSYKVLTSAGENLYRIYRQHRASLAARLNVTDMSVLASHLYFTLSTTELYTLEIDKQEMKVTLITYKEGDLSDSLVASGTFGYYEETAELAIFKPFLKSIFGSTSELKYSLF